MEKIKSKFETILEIMKNSAVIILFFTVMTVLISCVLFFFKVSISAKNVIISAIITVVFAIVFYGRNSKKDFIKTIISLVLSMLIVVVSIFISSKFYDTSWDGNAYHKLGVGILRDGWNPVYESAKDFIKKDTKKVGISADGTNNIWIEHYPKFTWIFGANIYSVVNNIEAGKCITMIMMYSCFSICLYGLSKKINLLLSIMIAGIIAVNPITMPQVFSYYLDGLMGLMLYLILFALVELSHKNVENRKENMLILALSIILCANLKFTGLVYAGVFCFLFFVLWVYRAYKAKNLVREVAKIVAFYLVTLVIALLVIGFSTYVKNCINKSNPFFPLMGKNKIDIMTENEPSSFIEEKNNMKKFVISMFSKGTNIMPNSEQKAPELKVPFTTDMDELHKYVAPDVRISGFGIWFGPIFAISMIGCVLLIILHRKDKKENCLMLVGYLLFSLILILITDGTWWARYIPYIYAIPIIVSILFSVEKSKRLKWISWLIIILLIVNNGVISAISLKYANYKTEMRNTEYNKMREISEDNEKVMIILLHKNFSGVLYNFRDKNIEYELINSWAKLAEPIIENDFYASGRLKKE